MLSPGRGDAYPQVVQGMLDKTGAGSRKAPRIADGDARIVALMPELETYIADGVDPFKHGPFR